MAGCEDSQPAINYQPAHDAAQRISQMAMMMSFICPPP
jgi:hypothetical protein